MVETDFEDHSGEEIQLRWATYRVPQTTILSTPPPLHVYQDVLYNLGILNTCNDSHRAAALFAGCHINPNAARSNTRFNRCYHASECGPLLPRVRMRPTATTRLCPGHGGVTFRWALLFTCVCDRFPSSSSSGCNLRPPSTIGRMAAPHEHSMEPRLGAPVRLTRGRGTSAASRARKSNGGWPPRLKIM